MVPVAICGFLVKEKHDHVIQGQKITFSTQEYRFLEFLTIFKLGQLVEVERFVFVNGEIIEV